MKKYILFTVVIALFMYSCGDDDTTNAVRDTINDPTTLLPSMSAKVDGNDWETTSDVPPAGLYTIDSVTLSITGFNPADSSTIVLIIENPEEKSYDLADSTGGASAFYDATNYAVSGNITVSNLTVGKVISGTFAFESEDDSLFSDPHSITEGEFKNVPIGN